MLTKYYSAALFVSNKQASELFVDYLTSLPKSLWASKLWKFLITVCLLQVKDSFGPKFDFRMKKYP